MDFLGFTDGRNGEEGEQTIYTTFYKSFSDNSITYESGLELDFSKSQTFDDVANVLIAKMNEYGGYDRTKVKYGKGYKIKNILYHFFFCL